MSHRKLKTSVVRKGQKMVALTEEEIRAALDAGRRLRKKMTAQQFSPLRSNLRYRA